ncbi:MAG: hypothetical protein QF890_14570 [Myxococcota bacterium]|nr:hypothetical protein [Deltaproteobacteria bacterium]MCP4242499.1 hypothetical protein [bacterium]MDP6074823.1 hypothetical protein [Myxococcota bacterium]MDP6244405.1 hypothetical protein [Myxococcota bacterium]MDP7075733.1 hypothetical protein [Myxococcota bacterium]
MRRTRGDPAARAPAPPRTAQEALERARHHARTAAAEAVTALHAVLDAAALARDGSPAEAHVLLGPAARLLIQLARDLESEANSHAESLLVAVARAVDDEVARWEQSARDDTDARAVLRAFLGLRELLWEVGVRDPSSDTGSDGTHRPGQRTRSAPRVQRVSVEG